MRHLFLCDCSAERLESTVSHEAKQKGSLLGAEVFGLQYFLLRVYNVYSSKMECFVGASSEKPEETSYAREQIS